MDACIQAQLKANATVLNYVDTACFVADADGGNRRPVLANLQVNQNGRMTRLAVPVLSIVQLPFMEITKCSIDFRPKPPATADGPQEYTTEIKVETQKAPMAPGLAAAINIFSGSITEAPIGGELCLEPTMGIFRQVGERQEFAAVVKNSFGLLVEGAAVCFSLEGLPKDVKIVLEGDRRGGAVVAGPKPNSAVSNTDRTGRAYLILRIEGAPTNQRFHETVTLCATARIKDPERQGQDLTVSGKAYLELCLPATE
jgi:hypothetical protein